MSSSLYLKNLNLRNFATFENQDIDFHKSFNGIIGETGSGKSLILDAFQLLLGSRADKKLVRKGTECAVIEGTFEANGDFVRNFFDQIGHPSEDDFIVVKRIIYTTGKSKTFLNHLSCPLSTLTKFSKTFVDLVGQFENQKLTNPDYQLKLVDQFSGLDKKLNNYRQDYNRYLTVNEQIEITKGLLSDKGQKEDYLRFQLNELSKLELTKDEESQLIKGKETILNRDDLNRDLVGATDIVSDSDGCIIEQISRLEKIVNRTESNVFNEELIQNISEAKTLFEDISFGLSKIDLTLEDNVDLDEILEKLDCYQRLKRKFNVDTDGLITLKEKFETQLSHLNSLENSLLALVKQAEELENLLYEQATLIHDKRLSSSKILNKKISNNLRELNMEGATFLVEANKVSALNKNGITAVSFKSETNKGEGFYSIRDIASGGELSRILLCLRQVVASEDTINIFFFDEIDTGIGGETAIKIGRALREVSKKGQVLAITHLPQIAKEVDEIIYVDKRRTGQKGDERTISFVESKKGKDREAVIKLLAGIID